jgi:TRAP transporter TAXI family solute receptor
VRLRLLLAALLLPGCALSGCGRGPVVEDPPTDLVIAAGEASGVYYRYGDGLARALSAELPGTTVRARVTSGSVDNVVLLARREAGLAFSLADTAAEAVAGTGPFREPVPLRALARLYTNSVHVVVPESSPVDRVADLRGLRVSVGAAGSGTELTATRMLAVAGLGASSAVQVARAGVRESAEALAAGRLDAFFWSGGLPTEGITELVESADVRLLPTDDLLDGMRAAHGEYVVEQTIPSSVYGTSGDVSTIGVPNLLLVRADLPDDLARALTAGLFAAQPELVEAHPEARTLDERSAITTAPVRLHPGAAAHYRAAKPGVSEAWD